MKRMGWLFVLALAVPGTAAAQSVVWSAAPGAFVDPDFGEGTEVGPALVLGATLRADQRIALVVDVALARMDFPVAADQFHRNIGSATVAVKLMAGDARAGFGLSLGMGVLAWDDISKTDPGFRSSANANQTFVPGFVTRFAVGESWGVTLFAHDHVTGLVNRILDPDEGDLNHHFVLGGGVYFR